MAKLIWKNCLVQSQRDFLVENYGDLIEQEEPFFEKDANKIFDLIKNNFKKYEQIDLFNEKNREFLQQEEQFFKDNMAKPKARASAPAKRDIDPMDIFDDKEDREYLRYQKELFGSPETSEDESERESPATAHARPLDPKIEGLIRLKKQIKRSKESKQQNRRSSGNRR